MTSKKRLYCQIMKGFKFTAGFFALLTVFTGFWIQFGFPVPATAEDVRKLSKGQADIGIKVQLQAEKQIRGELFDLKWRLRALRKHMKINQGKDDLEMEKYLEQQIGELTALETTERNRREAYKEQLQKLEDQ